MRRLLSRLPIILGVSATLLSVSLVAAQADNTCSALLNQGLNQISTVCANLDGNTLCYGNNPVSATYFDGSGQTSNFSKLGDKIDLTNVDGVQPGIVSQAANTLGIALMNLRANLPAGLADQHVVLMNLGGLDIENRVAPQDVVKLGTPVDVKLIAGTDQHVSAVPVSDTVATLPTGASVSADAISPDGNWVRVVYQTKPGWVQRSALPADFNTTQLTTVGPTTYTSMQSFYLRAKDLDAYASTPCRPLSSYVLAQGPKDIPVDIRVEDVPIRIGSSVIMRVLPGDNQCGLFQLITLYGMATLYPDSANPILVPPGYSITAPVPCDSDGNADYTHPLVFSDWSTPQPMTQQDLEDLDSVNSISSNLLNYPIELPSIIKASGRTVITTIFFPNPDTTNEASTACEKGTLPGTVCQNLGLSNSLCGTVTTTGLNGFPSIDVSNCGPDTTVVQAPPWNPIAPQPAVCQNWLVYHTNMTGDWELFRLGDLPGGVQADPNLSRGVGAQIYDIAPAKSPDQSWVAFMSNRDGNWEIYITSVTSNDQRRITYNTSAIERNPVWSPDGKTIVYESSRNGNWDLYAFNVITGVETRLTTETGNDIDANWAPDSSKLIYQSDKSGVWQVYQLDLATLKTTLISDGSGDDHDPKYSNDGKQIVFRSYRDGASSDIYVMNADGSNPTLISDKAGNALNQIWSPDDKLIAYQSNLDGDDDIYVYDFAGGTTRKVTDNTIGDYAPTWICNSTTLVFTSDITKDSNLFSTDALPITAPAIQVQSATQLTTENLADQYPVNSPLKESASEEGSFPSPVKNK